MPTALTLWLVSASRVTTKQSSSHGREQRGLEKPPFHASVPSLHMHLPLNSHQLFGNTSLGNAMPRLTGWLEWHPTCLLRAGVSFPNPPFVSPCRVVKKMGVQVVAS